MQATPINHSENQVQLANPSMLERGEVSQLNGREVQSIFSSDVAKSAYWGAGLLIIGGELLVASQSRSATYVQQFGGVVGVGFLAIGGLFSSYCCTQLFKKVMNNEF